MNACKGLLLFRLYLSFLVSIASFQYSVLLIETRPHPALAFVLENAAIHLSDEWQLIVCHGKLNADFVDSTIRVASVNVQKRTTKLNLNVSYMSIPRLNELFLTKSFYGNIPSEMFLVMQTDSMICPGQENTINTFMEFDYIGAPWSNGR